MLRDAPKPYQQVATILNTYINSSGGWAKEAKSFRDDVLINISENQVQLLKAKVLEFTETLRSTVNNRVGDTGTYVLSFIPGVSNGSSLKKDLENAVKDIPDQEFTIFPDAKTPDTMEGNSPNDKEEETDKHGLAALVEQLRQLGSKPPKAHQDQQVDVDALLEQNRILKLTVQHLGDKLAELEGNEASSSKEQKKLHKKK